MPLPTKVNVARPEAWGYDALVEYGTPAADSLYLRLAAGPGRQMLFETVPPEQKTPNLTENPEDMTAESGQSFSRADFGGGEGLRRAHRRDGTSRDFTRFWDSDGVDIEPSESGEATTLKLLKSGSLLRSGSFGNQMTMTQLGGVLYAITTTQRIDRTANPTAASPTWTVEDPHAGEGTDTVTTIAFLGNELYAGIETNGVHKRSTGGTWTHFSDRTGIGNLWAVKERLLGQVNGIDLYEVRAGAGSILLHTSVGAPWAAVADGGSAILAAAGRKIYLFVEEAGELVLANQEQVTIDVNEVIRSLTVVAGLVFIGTSEANSAGGHVGRLYRAVLVGNRLRERQLIRKWGSATSINLTYPLPLVASGNAVYMGIGVSATRLEIWKYSLITGGMSRDIVIDPVVDPTALEVIESIDDRLFMMVSNDGVYRENLTYVSSGYLISPVADFYNAGLKAWLGARLHTGAMPAGTQVVLAYSVDPAALDNPAHASWVNIITATPAAPGASAESPITGVESRFIAAKLTLTPNGTNTATPEVLGFALRGIQVPIEVDYQIPVNISDRIERPHRKPLEVNGVGDAVYQKLASLVGKAVTVTFSRPVESVKGQIRGISAPIQELSERGSVTVYALLTVRGDRQ